MSKDSRKKPVTFDLVHWLLGSQMSFRMERAELLAADFRNVLTRLHRLLWVIPGAAVQMVSGTGLNAPQYRPERSTLRLPLQQKRKLFVYNINILQADVLCRCPPKWKKVSIGSRMDFCLNCFGQKLNSSMQHKKICHTQSWEHWKHINYNFQMGISFVSQIQTFSSQTSNKKMYSL